MKLSDLPNLEAVVSRYPFAHPFYQYFFRWRRGVPKAIVTIANDPERRRAFCRDMEQLERMSDTH